MVWVKWTVSRRGLASIMHIKSAAVIPLKSNVRLYFARVGPSSIIKSPSGCRLKKNLLSTNEIDTSSVQGHCSWFAPAWKWAPRYFMGQCSAHNIAWKASMSLHLNYISFESPCLWCCTKIRNKNLRKYSKSHPCVIVIRFKPLYSQAFGAAIEMATLVVFLTLIQSEK